jgi:hypothetical protein
MSRQGVIEEADGVLRWTRLGDYIRIRRLDDHRHADRDQNLRLSIYAKQNLCYMFHIQRIRPPCPAGVGGKKRVIEALRAGH